MANRKPKRALTVGELIDQLKQYPADAPVELEEGRAMGVVDDGGILITAFDGVYDPEYTKRFCGRGSPPVLQRPST